jgi:hypothetical protein
MFNRTIRALIAGKGNMISSHTRNMQVTRYKNVIIFDIPLYYETNELVEIIDAIKENNNLKITYSKKEQEPEPEPEKVPMIHD